MSKPSQYEMLWKAKVILVSGKTVFSHSFSLMNVTHSHTLYPENKHARVAKLPVHGRLVCNNSKPIFLIDSRIVES